MMPKKYAYLSGAAVAAIALAIVGGKSLADSSSGNRQPVFAVDASWPQPLPAPVGDDGDSLVADFIQDVSAEDPSDVTGHTLLKEKLRDALKGLTERERKILEMRFGLQDGYSHTLEDIGNIYQVTRERIRQLEAKALRKLRHPTRIHHLHGFLETKEDNA